MKYFLNTKIMFNGKETVVYVIDNNQPNNDGFYFARLYTEHDKPMGHATYSIEEDSLFISMEANDCPQIARHIGIALDEHLFHQSLRLGKGGKVNKLASFDSHYFHWLQGFRVHQSQKLPQALLAYNDESQNTPDINYLLGIFFDARIAQLKSGERILSRDLGSLHMYLPEDIINAWKLKYPMIAPVELANLESGEQLKSPTPLMMPASCSINYDDTDDSVDADEPDNETFQITFN